MKNGIFPGVISVFFILSAILGIGSTIIFSTSAFGDDFIGTPLPPLQSPIIIDTTATTDSLQTIDTETPSMSTSTLSSDIALLIIGLI